MSTQDELPQPAILLTVDLPMVSGGAVKKQPFFTAYQMREATAKLRTELAEARAECERLRVDAERWRTASMSRNLGIAFWGEHGQGIVYDKAAEIHVDRVIKADAIRSPMQASIASQIQGGGWPRTD